VPSRGHSLDDLVDTREDRGRDREAELIRGLEVDDEVEFNRLLEGKSAEFAPFKIRST
jgi:hypothetical protein